MFLNEAIQKSFDITKGKTYLEIGVAAGRTFSFIKAGLKIGVDPISPSPEVSNILSTTTQYYQTTSDNFFLNHAAIILGAKGLDFAFIDGLHTYHQSLQDVENCLYYLNKPGVIVMHDCNPKTVGLMQSGCSGDVWKTIVHLRSTRRDLRIFVLDFDYGLGFIYYGTPENVLPFSPESIHNMTFNDLDINRASLLNLKPADFFANFLLEYPGNEKNV